MFCNLTTIKVKYFKFGASNSSFKSNSLNQHLQFTYNLNKKNLILLLFANTILDPNF